MFNLTIYFTFAVKYVIKYNLFSKYSYVLDSAILEP